MERIVPIYDESQSTLKVKTEGSPARGMLNGGTLADLLACILSAVGGFTALGYSILFFTRFLENDTHLWGIFSAFILCFGLGAFAYIPAALTSWLGWRAHKRGRIVRDLRWALFLTLPWAVLSLVLVFVSDLPKIYSLPVLILTALLTLWAAFSLLRKT